MFLLVCFAPGMLTEATGWPTERGRVSWRLAFYCRSHVQSGLDSSEVQPCRLLLAAAASSALLRQLVSPPPPTASANLIGKWLMYKWSCSPHPAWDHIFVFPFTRRFRISVVYYRLETNGRKCGRLAGVFFQLQMWIRDLFMWVMWACFIPWPQITDSAEWWACHTSFFIFYFLNLNSIKCLQKPHKTERLGANKLADHYGNRVRSSNEKPSMPTLVTLQIYLLIQDHRSFQPDHKIWNQKLCQACRSSIIKSCHHQR